ncbi:MAG: metal-dependent hydrolase [Gammaproteobacteria bacterium]|nr:metal-dependent hydrolase [Gammaproteobacteria bacterium]
MDPLSQAALGAVAAQNSTRGKQLGIATIFGLLAGMSPDLDVFISSQSDPLLFLEYHRQFTHSLIFIPLGGFLCAFVLYFLVGRWQHVTFKKSFLYCTLGYATHGLLDACTSYGTQLFWPFSAVRVSWSNISIIDPIFTLPLIAFIVLTVTRKKVFYARAAFVWIFIYLGLGVIQRERAEMVGWELAQSRNHEPSRLEAKPAFGNLLVWKVIYEADSKYHVDGIRIGLDKTIYPGESIDKLAITRDFPWLNPNSQQAKDIERFRWFSDGFLTLSPEKPSRIIDARYSMLPNEVKGLWMIELSPTADFDEHVSYHHQTGEGRDKVNRLWDMILGR